jgi:hypothetical protein
VRSLIHAALTKLASATEPEAPRAILASMPRAADALCGVARGETARVRCHLRHRRTRVSATGQRDLWRVVVELPLLSDHIHVVLVRRRDRDVLDVVRIDSAN